MREDYITSRRLSHRPARLRVVLADADRYSRRALRATLEGRGILVCAEAEDLTGAAEATRRELPDVCLLDAAIAGHACKGVESVLAAAPEVQVVILSTSSSDEQLLEAVRAGASGHLTKALPSHALDAALRDVVAGSSGFPRRLERLLVAAFRGRGDPGD